MPQRYCLTLVIRYSHAYRYAFRMTTLAVRVPDSLMQALDELVSQGTYTNRTAAVRAALDRLVTDEQRRAVDRSIVEGYARKPAEPADPFVRDLAKRSIDIEPW